MKHVSDMIRITKRGNLFTGVALSTLPLLLGVLIGCGSSGPSTPPPTKSWVGPGSTLPAGTELMYVGDNGGVIYGVGVDPNSGQASAFGHIATLAAGDVGLAADAGGEVLYAASAAGGGPNLASFLVNQSKGVLSVASTLSLPVPPRKLAAIEANVYVIPDPSANSQQMFAFRINGNNGSLTQLNPAIALPGAANDLVIAGFGNNIPSWLGLTFDGSSEGEIQSIVRQPNGGSTGLQLNSPTASGTNPQGIRVTPDGKFVVVANQGTGNVSVFSLDQSSGILSAVSGSPFASGSAPGPVAIDPSGNFVFVGDSAAGNLYEYAIDSTGALTSVGGSPFSLGSSAQPSSIAVDPADKFVYVSIGTQQLAGFALDSSTGALSPISGSPFSVGAVTRDIVFVP